MKISKIIILIIALLVTTSCNVLKKKTSSERETNSSETIDNTTYRKGDTVHFVVPKINYRDTTIVTYNRQGSSIHTVYDKEGNISEVNCLTAQIEEQNRIIRELSDKLNNESKDKSSEVSGKFMIYGGIALVLIVCFALLLGFFYLKSITPKIPIL